MTFFSTFLINDGSAKATFTSRLIGIPNQFNRLRLT